MTTDNEQDLLRSMLVMASAGLDAAVKHLAQDAVAELILVDEKAQNSFEKFVARRLVSGGESLSTATPLNARLLAVVLASPSPQRTLIAEYVSHLTGGSLQSVESLFEIAAALGAEPNDIGLRPTDLKPIFDARNKIIHEMDINLEAHMRTRTVRSQTTMIRHTNRIFELIRQLIASVNARLERPRA